jgi:hypothetical protein
MNFVAAVTQQGGSSVQAWGSTTKQAKKKPMKQAPNDKGKKCGFNRGTSTTTAITPSTTTTDTTTITTTTAS